MVNFNTLTESLHIKSEIKFLFLLVIWDKLQLQSSGRKNNYFIMNCFALSQPPPRISGNECQMGVQSIAVQCVEKLKHAGIVKVGEKPFLLYLNIYSTCLGIETEITNRTL